MKIKFFIEVFKKDFTNLSFKALRVDTCTVCDSLAMQIKSFIAVEKLQAENDISLLWSNSPYYFLCFPLFLLRGALTRQK